jgi:hypothetical protein
MEKATKANPGANSLKYTEVADDPFWLQEGKATFGEKVRV